MKQKVTVIDLEGINPSYRVETVQEHSNGFENVHTCNAVKINGEQIETRGLSIEKEEDFIEVVAESETVVDIRTSETPIGSN